MKIEHSWAIYKRVLRYTLPFWPMLLLGVVANMAYAGIDAGLTYMLMPFLNKGFIEQDLTFIQWIPLILMCGIFMRGLVHGVGSYCMTGVARKVVMVFRQQLFRHYTGLPATYYDQSTSGQLLSKILYDVEQIAHVSADALTTFVQSICLLIGLLIVMFVISWQLSLLFLFTIPFVALIVKYTNKRIRRVSHEVQTSMGEVTSISEEAIANYQTMRIFGGISAATERFDRATNVSRQRDMKVAMTKAINVVAVQGVIAIGIAGIILAAIQLSSVLTVTAGGFVAMIAAMLQLIKPLKSLTTVISVVQRGLAGAESVFHLMDQPLESNRGQQQLQRARGEIVYHDVSFAYRKNSDLNLSQINLRIEPGQTVALVGRSGSGKTTLANLLPRFYELQQGCIYIDGVDIRELDLKNLREQIAVVSQQVSLFNDTIANNIAYGVADANDADIKAAAEAAFALEFIERLPQGFASRIGDKGVLLSGGQRQRIAIARAILKDAPIIILDEATSALDTESERFIQAALDAVMQNRTTIVIAHRLSTIEQADHIAVMDSGKIVEQGSHAELIARAGYYAKLHQLQFMSEAVNQV